MIPSPHGCQRLFGRNRCAAALPGRCPPIRGDGEPNPRVFQSIACTPLTSGTCSFRFRSIPNWSVAAAEGHPTQAPWKRICTRCSEVIPTSSTSPPSAWTAGRMRSMTRATRASRGESDPGVGAPGLAEVVGVCSLATGVPKSGTDDHRSGEIDALPRLCP